MEPKQRVTARAHARVGLLGNPSDIYSGYGLGFTVAELYAEVTLEASDEIGELGEMLGACWSLFSTTELQGRKMDRPFKLSSTTNIPFQSGLAGSSALLVAAIRCWTQWFGITLSRSRIAELAWRTEVDVLKIRAGPLDRLAQANEGLVSMDFSRDPFDEKSVERMDPGLLPPLLVAWHGIPGISSGDVHAPVFAKFQAGDANVRRVMEGLAENAKLGKKALLERDLETFLKCVDSNFDLRSQVFDIAPADRDLIELGRSMGAGAKFPGSGGAVLFACRDEGHRETVKLACEKRGLSILVPTVADPTPGGQKFRLRAVFLAAGFGTRLYPITLNTAKPLLEIGGKPMMSRIAHKVAEIQPVDGVVVANGRFYDDFVSWHAGYKAAFGIHIVNDGTMTNETRLGAVADLDLALSSLPPRNDVDGFLVAACDNLFDFDLRKLVDRFKRTGRGQLIVRQLPEPVPPKKYSEIVLAEDGRVVSFREKPEDPKSNLSAIAIYLLPRNLPALVKEYLARGANPDAPGYLLAWLSERMELEATMISGLWMDIGSKEDLEKANSVV